MPEAKTGLTLDEIQDEQRASIESGKPTPTQEENDFAALGASVIQKEDDGSDVDKNIHPPEVDAPGMERKGPVDDSRQIKRKEQKESQAEQPTRGGYQTRQAVPERTRAPAAPATPSHPPPLAHPHSE
jgi:hypothetical protein